MDAAFHLLPCPAAGARIVGVGGDGGAGLAADARVTQVVERKQRDGEALAQLPDVARGPVGEGAQLAHGDSAGQGEVGDLFERGAAAGLFAAQAGEPDFIVGNRFEEWLDLAQAAAAVGRDLVQQAVLGLLLGDRARGQQVDQVQVPLGGDAVAIGISCGEMIAGVEKEDGDLRL
jgi:hypothetical protein